MQFPILIQLMNCFSLTAINMAWCSLDNECMTLLCRTLPISITRLNIAGCRKTMTDESKYNNYILFNGFITHFFFFSNFRRKGFVKEVSGYYRIRFE